MEADKETMMEKDMRSTSYSTDFSEYKFNIEPGIYIYTLNRKKMTQKNNMTLFLEREDGTKHMVIVFPDSNYLGMKDVPVGNRLSVEFVMSRTGLVYAKSIVVVE